MGPGKLLNDANLEGLYPMKAGGTLGLV